MGISWGEGVFVGELKYRGDVLYIVQGRGGWMGGGGGENWREGWCLFVGELNTGKGESGGGGRRRFVAGEAILI